MISPNYMKMEHQFCRIMQKLGDRGINLDIQECQSYLDILKYQITEIDVDLKPLIPMNFKKLPNIKSKNYQDRWMKTGYPYEMNPDGTMSRWISEEANLGSTSQLRNYLLNNGWKPSSDKESWNIKKLPDGSYKRTTPKLPNDEVELELLAKQSPAFKLIADRMKRRHRQSTLEGYLNHVNRLNDTPLGLPSNRISMRINSCGCNTMRVSHSVVANVPRITSYFGRELRSLFIPTNDNVFCGCDIESLEARILAHYLDSPEFSKFIQENDIHTWFQNLLTNYVKDRSSAKNIEYAYMFGAGDEKLGAMCDSFVSSDLRRTGKEVRGILDNGIPNLKKFKTHLESQFKQSGAIQGLDGRRIICRKSYNLVNTACQSGGAISAKTWTCKTDSVIKEIADINIFMHDEIIYETSPNNSLQVGQAMLDCLKWTTDYLKLKVDLTAEYKIGKSWSEVK